MINIRLLDQTLNPYQQKVQCCAPQILTAYTTDYVARRKRKAEKIGWDIHSCMSQARLTLDGKPYCMKHAGPVAIRILIDIQRKEANGQGN